MRRVPARRRVRRPRQRLPAGPGAGDPPTAAARRGAPPARHGRRPRLTRETGEVTAAASGVARRAHLLLLLAAAVLRAPRLGAPPVLAAQLLRALLVEGRERRGLLLLPLARGVQLAELSWARGVCQLRAGRLCRLRTGAIGRLTPLERGTVPAQPQQLRHRRKRVRQRHLPSMAAAVASCPWFILARLLAPAAALPNIPTPPRPNSPQAQPRPQWGMSVRRTLGRASPRPSLFFVRGVAALPPLPRSYLVATTPCSSSSAAAATKPALASSACSCCALSIDARS